MMQHIVLPDQVERKLVFYLAMEEYVAAHLDELPLATEHGREAFFMWQVNPTVIFGRNQVMEAEVNLPYCRANGIQLFRRKSGGGCVYSDQGNIMFSYITGRSDVRMVFERYLGLLEAYLRRIGLNAVRSGRNDILVNGKKVSGNAFFLHRNAGIVHGTMLFDTDFEALSKAITPSAAKLESKGVSSVRQHVTNLKSEILAGGENVDGRYADMEVFKDYMLRCFCGNGGNEIVLNEEQVHEIERIETSYLAPGFLRGRNHRYNMAESRKIPGVGEVEAELSMDSDKICGVRLSGDFFPLKDGIDNILCDLLSGRSLAETDIYEAFDGMDAGEYVLGLETGQLAELILSCGVRSSGNAMIE